jgi:hypothetical protein
MADLTQAEWRKSTYSQHNGCVEVAFIEDGGVAVRDFKNRQGPVLQFAFCRMGGIRRWVYRREFDLPG